MALSAKFYLALSCLSLQYQAGTANRVTMMITAGPVPPPPVYLIASLLSFCCMSGICTVCGACCLWVLDKCCGCFSKCKRRSGNVQNSHLRRFSPSQSTQLHVCEIPQDAHVAPHQEFSSSRYTFQLHRRLENAQDVDSQERSLQGQGGEREEEHVPVDVETVLEVSQEQARYNYALLYS